MFGFGITELVLVLIVVLFFMGGKRLPQIGDGLGRGIAEFKKALRPSSSSHESPQKISSGEKEGGDSTS